jgi:high-affinity iron transporter
LFPAYLLSLREGLEAALIVGLTLGVLSRIGRPELRRPVWLGAALAAAVSLLLGAILQRIGLELEGPAEQIFEGLTMALAAVILTWMIFWMRAQARRMQDGMEADVRRAAQAGSSNAMFSLAFLAVLREGVELALFLTAAAFQADGRSSVAGGLLGLATAALLGYLIYGAAVRLNLRMFFQATGILLLLFAAGLVGHAVHEFNELGWIPAIREPIWDLSFLVREDTVAGSLLRSLFGYNADPSLTEALAYAVYLSTLVLAWRGLATPGPAAPAGRPRARGVS